jgi:chromosome segregation protein
MHLKKLIISGFKSFADRVVLNFDEGITGIVGPNGSGKSNVIDSVRWVMGEQNAKNLRGKTATDIIFAGSQKRQAMTMAEVTLVFDNSDFSSICPPEYRHEAEISLTRRLYIDGEREYLINKKPCRFKDIVGFFATTGLGGRSYSMIQQGQVDRILNSKPEDVREILEEAAGTALFKERAGAAERKLQATQDNLARIDDILLELERQLETLKVQVEKAREWKKYADDLRIKELKLFVFNYSQYREKQQALGSQIESETDKEAEYIGQIAFLESRLLELKEDLEGSDPQLDVLREQIASYREKSARAESSIMAALASIDNGNKRLAEIAAEIKNESLELADAEQAVDEAHKKMVAAQEELVQLNELIESFEGEVESAQQAFEVYQNRIEDLEDEIKNLDRLLESNAIRCEGIERDRKRASAEMEQHLERVSLLEQETKTLEAAVAVKQEAVAAQKEGLEKQMLAKQEKEQAIYARYQQIEALDAERDRCKEEYLNAKARYGSTAELIESAADVASDLKKLRENHATADAVVQGLLTDYISFSQATHELPATAIAAFELWAEKILVNDFAAFNELIRLAHLYKLSSLPVMVMSVRVRIDPAELMTWIAATGAVSLKSYINVTTEHPFVLNVLDRLYYLPAEELTQQEIEALPKGIIVFSEQGVVASGCDDLFIGIRGTKGVLSRKIELQELEELIQEKELDLAQGQSQLDELEALQNEDRLAVRELDESLKLQNHQTLQVMAEFQNVSQQRQHKMQLLEDGANQYAKSEEHHFSLTKELEQLGQNRITLGQERESLVADLTALKEDSLSVEERNAEYQRQFQQKKLDLAKLETRSQAFQEGYIASKNRLERVHTILSRRQEEKIRVEQEIEQARQNELQCKEEIQLYLGQKEVLDEELAKKREQNAAVLEEIRVIENKLKENREKQSEIERMMTRKNIELERLKANIENITLQAFEKYQIDLTSYEYKLENDFDSESTAQEISRLKSRIDKIGAVNMIAIEEYERASARREFIQAQKDEVVGSIGLLEEAICEIKETAKHKFLQTFAVINQNYKELFPILFPSGEAHLQLTNEEDPLGGGVDIFARLPGKTTQHMTLFSGGEKALTAISLIFALLKTKPTPFCFLDEVDAPLDEANVGRYNNILEALSSRFQFIVITHNRRTMEVLDQLYGVTMQEGGVSKVVGVDMKKDLPDHLKKAFKEKEKEKGEKTGREVTGATVS